MEHYTALLDTLSGGDTRGPTTARPADTDKVTEQDSQAPASPRNFRSSWPHGWKHSGHVTGLVVDFSKVNKNTLGELIEATLHHLRGKVETKRQLAPACSSAGAS